jgi:hypothetical protein
MKKKFDAVKFQRKVREELSKMYSTDRNSFVHMLKDKYGHKQKQKVGPNQIIKCISVLSRAKIKRQKQDDKT